MDDMDRDNQHRTSGMGFTYVSHFKKWDKIYFLGIYNFTLLQTFTAWNMPVHAFRDIGRGGVLNRNNLVKWELYYSVNEYLLEWIDDDDTNTRSADIHTTWKSHKYSQSLETLVRDILSVRYVLWKSE